MVALDLLLRGGVVVDGTGAPGVRADVGIRDGRIVSIGAPGSVDDTAAEVADVDGLIVAPGFIDLHTHYDVQALWDPALTPSPLHGVTTIIGGNCGFSIAPLGVAATGRGAAAHDADVDYVMRMMARVEGMPLEALRGGPTWNWTTFGEYLDRLDGRVAVNVGFLAGHSTIRRVAMGEAATDRRASTEQIEVMTGLLHDALTDGALGFSSSLGEAHTDGDGRPVPSRAADFEEFRALAAVLRDHPGTTLEFIPAVGEIPEARMNLMADMSVAADRPLNWNLLGSLSPVEIYEQQLRSSDVAAARGGTVVALTLPDVMRLRAGNLLNELTGWRDIAVMPDRERQRAIAESATRARLRDAVTAARGDGLAALQSWDLIEVAESAVAAHDQYVGKTIASIAAERGTDEVDVLIDVVLAGRVPLTLVLPSLVPTAGIGRKGWEARAAIWRDPRVFLGGSDAGAHVDLMCHANYPTVVLGHAVRDLGVIDLETAIHLMTDRPARLLGLRDRGRIALGAHADLVVFDPHRVASAPARLQADMPTGAERLHAGSVGIERVVVGGATIVIDGGVSEARPGTVLRSGRDTETVTPRGFSN